MGNRAYLQSYLPVEKLKESEKKYFNSLMDYHKGFITQEDLLKKAKMTIGLEKDGGAPLWEYTEYKGECYATYYTIIEDDRVISYSSINNIMPYIWLCAFKEDDQKIFNERFCKNGENKQVSFKKRYITTKESAEWNIRSRMHKAAAADNVESIMEVLDSLMTLENIIYKIPDKSLIEVSFGELAGNELKNGKTQNHVKEIGNNIELVGRNILTADGLPKTTDMQQVRRNSLMMQLKSR